MESTAEFAREELMTDAPELRMVPKVTFAAKSDLGRVREHNEDKYEFFLPEEERLLANRGLVFVVCDGMGGHSAGQIASELTCKTFIDVYMHHAAPQPETAARAAVEAANRFVIDIARSIPGRGGMGTTLSALLLVQDRAIIAQVGDSRVYRFREGVLEQISEEHTWVQEHLQEGLITPEEAEMHPNAHVLTRAVGAEENVLPQVEAFDCQVGDTYLLCSDGLTNHLSDDSIQSILSSWGPAEAVWRLVNAALADGGRDNCTALCVRVDALQEHGESE